MSEITGTLFSAAPAAEQAGAAPARFTVVNSTAAQGLQWDTPTIIKAIIIGLLVAEIIALLAISLAKRRRLHLREQ